MPSGTRGCPGWPDGLTVDVRPRCPGIGNLTSVDLRLRRGMVRLVHPDPRWGKVAVAEIARLRRALGSLAIEVRHIASTSIQAGAAAAHRPSSRLGDDGRGHLPVGRGAA